jgi:hypothetical protein
VAAKLVSASLASSEVSKASMEAAIRKGLKMARKLWHIFLDINSTKESFSLKAHKLNII